MHVWAGRDGSCFEFGSCDKKITSTQCILCVFAPPSTQTAQCSKVLQCTCMHFLGMYSLRARDKHKGTQCRQRTLILTYKNRIAFCCDLWLHGYHSAFLFQQHNTESISRAAHENIIIALAPLLENNHPTQEICDFFSLVSRECVSLAMVMVIQLNYLPSSLSPSSQGVYMS